MAPSVPVAHDPALSHIVANANNQQAPQGPTGIPQGLLGTDMSQISQLDSNQIMTLLRSLPTVFNKVLSTNLPLPLYSLHLLYQLSPFHHHTSRPRKPLDR